MSEFAGIEFETPQHTSVISYVKKIGIYALEKKKERADDWIIIIDESIEFGNEKILVILGIREKDIDFNRALKYQDLECLTIKISNSWKGEDIHDEIQILEKEIGKIKYAVADMGNAIKKALRLSELPHIEDITHKISWFIKELYHKDDRFVKYTKKLAHLRGSIPLSKLAYILPPAQRVNSRFMNLKPIIDWGNSVIRLLETDKELVAEREKLGFILEYKPFLCEIQQVVEISIKIQKLIKTKGLSKNTLKQCRCIFKNIEANKIINEFKEQLLSYLERLLSIELKIKSSKLLGSSDILESCFGKYKSFINANPSIGITDLCLSIAAITSNYRSENEILKAMETVKTKDLMMWKEKNIGKTLLSRRKEVIKKTGG